MLGAVAAQSLDGSADASRATRLRSRAPIRTSDLQLVRRAVLPCNGQPYYKCTCCTDYDPFVINKCATPGECDVGWSETRCMSGAPAAAGTTTSGTRPMTTRGSSGCTWGAADDDDDFAWDDAAAARPFLTSTAWRIRTALRRGGRVHELGVGRRLVVGRACNDGHLRGGLGVATPTFATAAPTFATAVPIFSTDRGPQFAADDAAVSADFGAERDTDGAPSEAPDVRRGRRLACRRRSLLPYPRRSQTAVPSATPTRSHRRPHHVAVPDGRAERDAERRSRRPRASSVPTVAERGAHASAHAAAVRRAHAVADARQPTEVPSPAPTISFRSSPVPTVPPTPEPGRRRCLRRDRRALPSAVPDYAALIASLRCLPTPSPADIPRCRRCLRCRRLSPRRHPRRRASKPPSMPPTPEPSAVPTVARRRRHLPLSPQRSLRRRRRRTAHGAPHDGAQRPSDDAADVRTDVDTIIDADAFAVRLAHDGNAESCAQSTTKRRPERGADIDADRSTVTGARRRPPHPRPPSQNTLRRCR